jgi:DNA-binding GntR family transcriptional regulator
MLKIKNYELLNQKVYKTLKKAILMGEIKPNTKLSLQEISKSLQISVTPIREAVSKLESEGLINVIPNKGFVINKISIDDFQEILQIRAALEGLIAELATKRITDEEIDNMMEIIKEMEISVKKDDRLEYNDLDIKFHDFLLIIAENKKLKEVYRRLVLQVYKFRLRTLKLSYRMQKSLEEHKSIALRIKERDSDGAIRASQEHIKSILQSLEEDEERTREAKV